MTDPCQSTKEIPFDVLVLFILSQKELSTINITIKIRRRLERD